MSPSSSSAARRIIPAVVVALACVLAITLAPPVAGQVGAVGDVPPTRISGADRVATSEAVVARWVAEGGRADVVIVAPAADTAIALTSAGLAGQHDGITVLSASPPDGSTVDAVRSTGASEVVVVGGDAALAAGWADAGLDVTHLTTDGGAPAIAATVARAQFASASTDGPRSVLLAGTGGLPDALAAGPLAHRGSTPMLLTAAHALDPHTAFLIDRSEVAEVIVLGGTAVVSDAVVQDITALGATVRRIAGSDREQTAMAVAREIAGLDAGAPTLAGVPLDAGVMFAAGDDPADAASAAGLAAHAGQPILPPGSQVQAALAQQCGEIGHLTVLGGVAAITATTEDRHRAAAQRCDGVRDPMQVRVAVVTPGAPGEEAAVLGMVVGAEGWTSRRVRFQGVSEAPHLGVIIGGARVCGEAVVCRSGRNLVIDGAHWAAADTTRRQRLISHAVGGWLGEPVGASCTGRVMDPLDCAEGGATVAPDDRERVADRFVPTARLAFGGDVMAERHIATALAQGRNPLDPVAGHLAAADLAILNLETPLSTRGTPAAKTFVFRGPPAMAGALAAAGVDIVSLANNHALDYGVVALLDTLDHVAATGVATVGAGVDAAQAYAPVVRETPAGTVAVIGLTRVLHTRAWEATATRPGLASAYDEPAALAAVAQARAAADHVVVAIHWGTERADCPDPNQRRLATLLSDAGADVVVGHHPHVLQGVQVRGDTLIAYSLGNFVWYHNAAPSRFTGILDVELPLLDAPRWGFTPAEIGTDGSPRIAGGALGDSITARLTTRSPGGAVGCGFPA